MMIVVNLMTRVIIALYELSSALKKFYKTFNPEPSAEQEPQDVDELINIEFSLEGDKNIYRFTLRNYDLVEELVLFSPDIKGVLHTYKTSDSFEGTKKSAIYVAKRAVQQYEYELKSKKKQEQQRLKEEEAEQKAKTKMQAELHGKTFKAYE